MPPVQDTSLEARFADLERQVRDLRARNPLDLASVVSASGRSVPVSQLAFGVVGWQWADNQIGTGVDGFQLNGAANAAGGTGWVVPPAPFINPTLDVYVSGGNLRVDLAGNLVASGRAAGMAMSYRLVGPSLTQADLGTAPVVVNGDSVRAVSVYAPVVNGAYAGAQVGTFYLEQGLSPGWYRIAGRYALTYGADSTVVPSGQVGVPRIALTPY